MTEEQLITRRDEAIKRTRRELIRAADRMRRVAIHVADHDIAIKLEEVRIALSQLPE